jgi:hypothetical protein
MGSPLLNEIIEKLSLPELPSKGWLLKRLKKISPEDFSALIDFMTQESFLPFLSAITKEYSLPWDIRNTALETRRKLGDKLDPEEDNLLRQEQEILQMFQRLVTNDTFATPSVHPDMSYGVERWVALPQPAAKSILQYLVRKIDKAVLPLLKEIYRNSPEQYAAIALEIIASMKDVEAREFLYEIAASEEKKSLQKAARKLLYRLREQKLPGDTKIMPKPVFSPPDYKISKAWVSFIDSLGNRFILLLKPQPLGKMLLINLSLSDTQGIVECLTTTALKKDIFPAIDKGIAEKQIIEIDTQYAMALIEEYREINKKTARQLPEEFVASLGHIDIGRETTDPEIPYPPIYQLISKESLQDTPYIWRRSDELFQLPELNSWRLPPAELEKYLLKLREIKEGFIIVSDYLQRERIEEVYQEAIKEIFTPEKRTLYRRRLEEMAYFLWVTGKPEEGRLALIAAVYLEELQGNEILEHPFVRQLVYRSLESHLN